MLRHEVVEDFDFGGKLPACRIDRVNRRLGQLIVRQHLLQASGCKIVKVFYPVFPPDKNAEEVIAWLRDR